jgi:MFS family permease
MIRCLIRADASGGVIGMTGDGVSTEPEQKRRRRGTHGIRALRHRNFRLFFVGQLVSLIGTWMQTVAQSWLVYRLTGSAALLGAIAFAGQIPVFLFSPIGGSVADAVDRRKIVIGTQTAAMILAIGLAFLALSGEIRMWQIFTLSALLGIVNAFDIPARQSLLVELVGREDLMNAIALNSSMFTGARIVGPAVAGALVAVVGEGWCFFLNGVSYIAVLVGLFLMRVPPRPIKPSQETPLGRMIAGFRYVVQTAPVRALLLLLGLSSLMGAPYFTLMPIFADEILARGARGLGILMSASGAGALLAALVLAHREDLRGLTRWVAVSSAGFGVALVAFSLSQTFWLSAALLVPVGFAMMVQMAASNTLIQSMAPDELRGRVMSVYTMMFMGMAPLGALLAGWTAERFGAPTAVRLGGIGCLVLGAIPFAFRVPALRAEARRLVLAQHAGAD